MGWQIGAYQPGRSCNGVGADKYCNLVAVKLIDFLLYRNVKGKWLYFYDRVGQDTCTPFLDQLTQVTGLMSGSCHHDSQTGQNAGVLIWHRVPQELCRRRVAADHPPVADQAVLPAGSDH